MIFDGPTIKMISLQLTFALVPLLLSEQLSQIVAQSSSSSTRALQNLQKTSYEVWASDQSNSVPDQSSAGVNGSYLWIWDSDSINDQLNSYIDAVPLSCTPNKSVGPCDLWDVFPSTLSEIRADGSFTELTLGDLPKFGRLHGMLKDPQARYFTASMYAPGKCCHRSFSLSH